MQTDETFLREVSDRDFDWMLSGAPESGDGLRLPPGGIDEPNVLVIVRKIVGGLLAADCHGAWMVVVGDEVVGMCSFHRPPSDGEAEIGYGIAASRRNHGYATAAVGLAAAEALKLGLTALKAETSVTNPSSSRVLEKNGFERTGTRVDPKDGEVFMWRKSID